MTDPNSIVPLSSDLSDCVLTLNLAIWEDDSLHVRSCEILGRGFRNRVSFQDTSELEQVLVAKVAHSIRKSMSGLSEGAQVLSLPDFLVELPGLVLSGAHILVMKLKDGKRNAIMRFKEFMGSLNIAFHPNVGFQESYANHAERLATNVLADICLPLLNMCRDMEYAQVDAQDRLPRGFSERAREFEFQTELLKRFIFNAGIGHAAPTQMHLDEDYRPQPLSLPRT